MGADACVHVVYVAGVRHLLDVHAHLLLGARHGSHNALLNNILQVQEPTPNVPHVLKRVGARTRVPVAKEEKNKEPGSVHLSSSRTSLPL